MLYIEEIKKQGTISALSAALDSRVYELGRITEGTRRNDHYCGMNKALGKARELIEEADTILKELERLDPRNV